MVVRIAVAQLAVSEDVNANYERTLEVIREADGNGRSCSGRRII